MATKSTIPAELQTTIKKGMIQGYKDDEGTKIYPSLKDTAKYYKISYDALRQLAKDWNWKQERQIYKDQVHRKYLEKKKSEEMSEAEAEELVIKDKEYNDTASKLRNTIDSEITRIAEGKIFLYFNKKSGEPVYGVPKNAAYLLMNLGKALESAHKTAKLAAGEPSEISKVEGTVKYKDRFDSIMDGALENLESDEDNSDEIEPVVAKPAGTAKGTRKQINLG